MATTTASMNLYGATLSRRQFVKTGGVLIVGVSLVGPELLNAGVKAAQRTVGAHIPDPTLPSSWFEIRADNTMIIHTGSCDFGQSSTTTAFKQIVADELDFPYDSITSVVEGDTDRTPDGSVSAGYLHRGGLNLRKAAAYTRQALLDLAAATLGVDKNRLTVKDGVVSGGGKSMTYGQLVAGQELTLRIPVTGELTAMQGLRVAGDPPMKPTNQYTVIGKSFANPATPAKVVARANWVTDVHLPGMLHARVIHPKTVGSRLVAAGKVDKKRFPDAQVIVQGDLVGVVAPTEWEALGAAQEVAAATKWTEWKGLPGHVNLYAWLREHADWNAAPVTTGPRNQGDPSASLTGATRKLSATYELPFIKHAPIGPTAAVADARPDGDGLRLHAYPESVVSPRPIGADARHVNRQHRRPCVSGSRPLWTVERWERGRRGRSGALVEGGRPAGARAVDAAGRPHVVDEFAARLLRRAARPRCTRQHCRRAARSLHACDAG